MRDARIKRPCPFCDETVHLRVHTEACPFPIVEGNETVKGEDRYDLENYVDGIACEVCGALVPLVVWNREISRGEFVIRRAFDLTDDGKCGCGHDAHTSAEMQEVA